ncbi:hypothetical protein [Dyadobacter luticola]|uniref:Uncharacterized protein n=1 Tax=Dyadobacter luticola TaxID=1979387 RepID=A0A5R9KPC8_9BACT|nr:hypothetical protein [Dyadobacter luticola]TLU97999.1 hypothetical protein FEN17_24735 [Dyadobacter luticola]
MQLHFFRSAKRWDSALLPIDDNTFGLILQFRVRLVRVEPTTRFFMSDTYATGNGRLHDTYGTFHLDAWTNQEWESYKTNFVNVVQRHWSDKFVLDPDRAWYRPRMGANLTSAIIQCGLSIELVETSAQAHQTFRIIHPRENNFRSYVEMYNRTGLFTHLDLEPQWGGGRLTRVGNARHSIDFLQTTINHEFGHTLGLNHVNGVGNSDNNYGITLEQRENQMGLGGRLTTRHGRPWLNSLVDRHHIIPERRHLPEDRVKFTARVDSPQLIEYWDDDWQPTAAATH